MCVISAYIFCYKAAFADEDFDLTLISFEGIFLVDMFLIFLTEYVPKDIDGTGKEAKPVRELGKIAKNYVYGDFLFDIIPLVPLQLISIKARLNNLFYLIKVIRFVKGKELFNIMELMKNVKEYNKEKI